MTKPIDVRPEAEEEMLRAYDWYEAQRPGLGDDFLSSIDEGFAQISEAPEMFPIAYSNVRRALIRKFPHGVFYTVDAQRIVVLAVYHGNRDPISLKTRK